MSTSTKRRPPVLPAFFTLLGVAACGAGAGLFASALLGNTRAIVENENAGFVGVTSVVFLLGTLFVTALVAWMGGHNLLLTGRPRTIWYAVCGVVALVAAVVAVAVLT